MIFYPISGQISGQNISKTPQTVAVQGVFVAEKEGFEPAEITRKKVDFTGFLQDS